MGVQYMELRGMIDLALGHPEKGIVNFNVLHSLLNEILDRLDKNTSESNPNKETNVLQNERTDYLSGSKLPEADSTQVLRVQTSEDGIAATVFHENLSSKAIKPSEFEERLASIETRLEALNSLTSDKSFHAQSTELEDGQAGPAAKENALAIMWKYMTIHRRVQATEEAVEKVMTILSDVVEDIGELKKVKSHLEEIRQEQLKVSGEFEAMKSNSGLESNLEMLTSLDGVAFKRDLRPFVTWTSLEKALNKKEIEAEVKLTNVEDRVEQLSPERPETAPLPLSPRNITGQQEPPRTALSPKEFTKLTGQNPDEINKDTLTTNEERKEGLLSSEENSLDETSEDHLHSEVPSEEDTKDSMTQPSSEFLYQLNRIGELPKQYDDVVGQVSMMSKLQNKVAGDKVDNEDLQLLKKLVEQIDTLKRELDMLNTNQDLLMLATIKETSVQNKENIDGLRRELAMFSQHLKKLELGREAKTPEAIVPSYDQEVLNSVREKLNNVEQEQEKIVLKSKEDVGKILENLDEKQRVIDELFQYAERLQERKADRENVANEMDVKADKNALENKVNQSTFDETFQMFDRGLQEALQKMEDYMNEEMALKDTLSRISHDMEGKIDNDSLQLMKSYFERQIKDVQESRDKIARETRVDAVDAAGVRRKLPIHYHCISCNRPVELPVRDSEPALPESESLPLRRLRIPFASYEAEQLRQKSLKGNYNAEESAAIRDLVSNRPCGGSHTVINPQLRKSTKFHQFSQSMAVREDQRFVPKIVREVSVLDFLRGSDGHYYKGRSRQLLPAIPRRTKYPSNADVSMDSSSFKGNGILQEETSHTTDQQKGASHDRLRTPSPPVQDNLSSSYPERSEPTAPTLQGQVYSSDDLHIPSNTGLNRESLKIFRRKRGQDKESKRQRCWDGQLTNAKGDHNDQSSDSNESTSPKSLKRTTPVGEEQPYISPSERTPHKDDLHDKTTKNISRISGGSDNTDLK